MLNIYEVAKAQNAMDDAYLDRDGLASELEMVQEQNTRAQEEIEEVPSFKNSKSFSNLKNVIKL